VNYPNRFKISHVEDFFNNQPLKPGQRKYADFHKYRYLKILNILDFLKTKIEKHTSISLLDIGPRQQTNLIRQSLAPVIVNSLGHAWPNNKMTEQEYHIEVDLNETQDVDVTAYQKNDIVIYAEVMEHLYTMPQVVLAYLSNMMTDRGYIIIQTPNGVALNRRLAMLAGKNPFQMIAPHRQNHYREYTLPELKTIAIESGFSIEYAKIENYFNPDENIGQRLFNKLGPLLPSGLRSGITMVIQKNNT